MTHSVEKEICDTTQKTLLLGAALSGLLVASGRAHSHDSMTGGEMAKG